MKILVIVMNSGRTFQQLADELTALYGPMATSVFRCYSTHNPLRTDRPEIYWENIRIFLHELHTILYTRDNKLNIEVIPTEAYFFLCKMCVDRSFTVANLIDIRNDRTVKHNKNIANDLSHNVLPQYITMRRQFDYHGLAPQAQPGTVATPPMPPMHNMMSMPQMQPYHTPPMMGMPGMSNMPYMGMPSMSNMPYIGMPSMPYMPYMPHMGMPGPVQQTQSIRQAAETIRIRPRILRRRDASDWKKGKGELDREVTIPLHNLQDSMPLDFYTVHRCDTNGAIPQVTPVPNRPPPPSP